MSIPISQFIPPSLLFLSKTSQDFPGGPVVKTPCFQCRGMGSIPGQGTKIPQAVWPKKKKKRKEKEKKKKM